MKIYLIIAKYKKLIIKIIAIAIWLYLYVVLGVWFERGFEIQEPVFYMLFGTIMFFINITVLQIIEKWQTPKFGRRKNDLKKKEELPENVELIKKVRSSK